MILEFLRIFFGFGGPCGQARWGLHFFPDTRIAWTLGGRRCQCCESHFVFMGLEAGSRAGGGRNLVQRNISDGGLSAGQALDGEAVMIGCANGAFDWQSGRMLVRGFAHGLVVSGFTNVGPSEGSPRPGRGTRQRRQPDVERRRAVHASFRPPRSGIH